MTPKHYFTNQKPNMYVHNYYRGMKYYLPTIFGFAYWFSERYTDNEEIKSMNELMDFGKPVLPYEFKSNPL